MNSDAMLKQLLCHIFCGCEKKPQPRAKVTLSVGAVSVTVIPEGAIMFSLPDDKVANAAVTYVDAKGNAAKVDGVPVWASSDENVVTVAASADGMSAVVTPVGTIGTAQVSINADADLGAGVVALVSLVDIDVIAGQAVAGNVSLSLA